MQFTDYIHSSPGANTFQAINPADGSLLPGHFPRANAEEIEQALAQAEAAFGVYRNTSNPQKSAFLRAIASEIEALGSALIERAMLESGLPEGRLTGERGRTCNQLRMFAQLLEEGSWVDAVIDPALPERQPLPRPDIRRMLMPLGPVVVFTASNFPLAFSTAGGDTASALAAGCPVIVKAHPAHPGTNALVTEAIQNAALQCEMPVGVFTSLYDDGFACGAALVRDPRVQAVAFTGSFAGGMALHKMAAERPDPIPVFAEMGSINPMFLLPEKVAADPQGMAQMIAGSVNLGAGQFCTNPGVLVALDDSGTVHLIEALKDAFGAQAPSQMLHSGIHRQYEHGLSELLAMEEVEVLYEHPEAEGVRGRPAVALADAADFIQNPDLQREVFGPFTMLIRCADAAEMEAVARALNGQLTASVLGNEAELSDWQGLFDVLQTKVGRLIFNSVPTGVEVCAAMQHGGPFPASTDSRFTSVGTGAIQRFARPVAFQDCPDALLPDALKAGNPLGIWRLVDGVFAK